MLEVDQPYPPQTSSPQGYPPQPLRTGPAPFYVVAQQHQQAPPEPQASQGQHSYPQRDPTPRIPSNSMPAPLQTGSPPPNQYPPQQAQTGHRPQSTYSNPQELATSVYDSPIGQQPNSAYSASLYSQDDPYSAGASANSQPPPSQQQYNAYAPPQQQYPAPHQPSYDAPAPPTGSAPPPPTGNINAGYPSIGQQQDARQTLPSQGAASQPQYKPYQRPGSAEGHNLSAPSAPPGGPADFYRQSAAY